jgi:hypothetical protein
MAILAAALLMAGCHEGCDSESPTEPSGIVSQPSVTDVTGVISLNHGHIAVVTAAQIQAAQALTMSIQGTALHSHTISLTGAQLTQIGQGRRVSVVSSPAFADLHVHDVTFN